MRREDILQLTRTQPFVPFRIFTTLGESFDIKHPDMILATPGTVHVITPHPQKPSDEDGWVRILSLYHLHHIEFLPSPPAKTGMNGIHSPTNES